MSFYLASAPVSAGSPVMSALHLLIPSVHRELKYCKQRFPY